jgi:hypothetical protein
LALKTPGFALKALGLPFSLALQELDLAFIPGLQARHGAGPAHLASPRSALSTMAPTITRS